MLTKARNNAAKIETQNTSFVSSRITQVALPDAVADVVISNCVINLVPDAEKHWVFKEVFRLLKPGGRVAVSDILARKELPEQMKSDLALYVGCIAGSSKKEDYETCLEEAGFRGAVVVDSEMDLNVYTRTGDQADVDLSCCESTGEKPSDISISEVSGGGCCSSKQSDVGVLEGMKTNFRDVDLNEWAGMFCSANLITEAFSSICTGAFRIFAVKGV